MHGSVQMYNVSRGVKEPSYLFFYLLWESLLILIQQNQVAVCVDVCVCVCVCVGALSPLPWELAAAQRVRANFAAVLPVSY